MRYCSITSCGAVCTKLGYWVKQDERNNDKKTKKGKKKERKEERMEDETS
jgi:hypothetical protein